MAHPNLRDESDTREMLDINDGCPRCDMIFTMLETTPTGEHVQHIEMVERGQTRAMTKGITLLVKIYYLPSHSTY